MKPTVVLIEWMDVMTFDAPLLEVSDLEDIETPKASIVGFLVHETDEAYYIAKEWWETDQFKYVHIIPKNTAILSIKELTV